MRQLDLPVIACKSAKSNIRLGVDGTWCNKGVRGPLNSTWCDNGIRGPTWRMLLCVQYSNIERISTFSPDTIGLITLFILRRRYVLLDSSSNRHSSA